MPYSSSTFDDFIGRMLSIITPRRVLDIGCGAGKYSDIVRESCPEAVLVGYEAESSYIERFSLVSRYDELRCRPILDLLDEGVRERWDICIFGDVLEHLRKSVACDILHFLLYRSRVILAIVPIEYLQDDHDGVRSEAHVSSWHFREFEAATDCIALAKGNAWMGLLRGYLSSVEDFGHLFGLLQGLDDHVQYLPRLKFGT
jgi:hypothetical protein